MASSPKAFQTRNAAGEAAPLLRSWHEITSGLEAACRSSVGPAGRPAMLLSTSTASTEPMTVTKCGSDIISSFAGDHPLADVIISGVRAHVDHFGDGAKSVALFLSGFLKALETKGLVQGGEGRCRILAQIRQFRRQKLQRFREHVRVRSRVEVGDQSSKKAVVGSFFLSRFNSNCLAATRLAEIAMELEEHDRESVSRCVTVFDEPVSRSRIERGGYLLSRQITRPRSDVAKGHEGRSKGPATTKATKINTGNGGGTGSHSNFIIWTAEGRKKKGKDEQVLMAADDDDDDGCSRTIEKFLAWRCDGLSAFLRHLRDRHRLGLVLCAFGVPSYARDIFLHLGIAYADHIPRDEASDLAKLAGVVPWSGEIEGSVASAFSEGLHLGQLSGDPGEVLVGGDVYAKLELEGDCLSQPVVCGPTQSAAKQHSMALAQCLKLVATSTTENRILTTTAFEREAVDFLDQLKPDPKVGDVVWALKQVMIDIMFVKSKAKPPPRRFADIWDVVAVESKMQQVETALSIAERLLSIGEICRSGKRVKDLTQLPRKEDDDSDSDSD